MQVIPNSTLEQQLCNIPSASVRWCHICWQWLQIFYPLTANNPTSKYPIFDIFFARVQDKISFLTFALGGEVVVFF